MSKIKIKIKKEIKEFKLLLKSVPAGLVVLFVMAVFAMNLLANKSINLPFSWLALDCGIIVSWIAFLTMDVITTHFGPKASNKISLLATGFNLLFCLLFLLGSKLPGTWGESYIEGSEQVINNALDGTFGGTWYILLGSTVAFVLSAFINNFLNYIIGKALKNKKGFIVFILRSYLSTAVGQFADNLTFALIVSHNFFGWSFTQCVNCALFGMAAELICEALFSYFGYKITLRWKKENVGKEYIDYMKGEGK